MHCKQWNKDIFRGSKEQMKKHLWQGLKEKFDQIFFYKGSHEGIRETGKNWQQNQKNFNSKGKEKKENFLAYKYCQKTNHLEAWCWLKNAQCRNCK